MTLDECRASAALLGFCETLGELDDSAETAFCAALNRAIWETDAIRPHTGVVTLLHYPEQNKLARWDWYHYAGCEDTVSAIGDAYCFSVSGTGSCTVSNGYRTVVHTWRGESMPRVFRGFLSGVLELTFSGDTNYPVHGVAVYEGKGFRTLEEIPLWEEESVYDLSLFDGQAIAITQPPAIRHKNGYYPLTGDYRIQNRKELALPRRACGEYRIVYRKAPPQYAPHTAGDVEIAMDGDLASLLPLQIAYFLLLDSDPEKAGLYLQQFKEGAYRIAAAERPVGQAVCQSVNGW